MGAYTANADFVKRLKAIDPELYVLWNHNKERWDIMLPSMFGGEVILRVENEDGSYRPLDQRSLDWLNYNRLSRSANMRRERLEKFERQDRLKEKRFNSSVRELAEYGADFISNYHTQKPRFY